MANTFLKLLCKRILARRFLAIVMAIIFLALLCKRILACSLFLVQPLGESNFLTIVPFALCSVLHPPPGLAFLPAESLRQCAPVLRHLYEGISSLDGFRRA
jgi:hypothetical protein